MKFINPLLNSRKKYFITTPIFYVNSTPHIGHLYTALLADAQARWRFLKGEHDEIFFATGTDEHGYKIQKKAKLEDQDCKKFCDNISAKFKDLFDELNIKYTDFIRTTETRHHHAVHHFWNTLNNNGFIYKSTYEGWYSTNDECFLKEDEIHEKKDEKGNLVKYSNESGHMVERISETNYMFKLTHFKDKLKDYLSNHIIIPDKYENLLMKQIDSLEDLSISRESKRVFWGINVPNDQSQIIYVWLDALVNYLTVAGYPNDMKKFSSLHPADVHVVGKDILRFHAIYWPSFLMAANLELPQKILCHGHWLMENKKMSKSIGNIICPFQSMKKYTKDGLRYFLLREGVPSSDCSIHEERFATFINQELVNTLGNLYQRCLPFNKNMTYLPFNEIKDFLDDKDKDFLTNLNILRELCAKHFEDFNFYLGIQLIMSQIRHGNNLVQEYKPWDLVKENGDVEKNSLKKLIFLVNETLRITTILLQPIVPDLANDVLERLNVSKQERTYFNAVVDYGRVESKCMIKKSDVIFKRV